MERGKLRYDRLHIVHQAYFNNSESSVKQQNEFIETGQLSDAVDSPKKGGPLRTDPELQAMIEIEEAKLEQRRRENAR